ncbi:MAG: hypothetical protein E7B11_08450 [Clostridiales bacterium]|nr:hypothetical protein [Clostridiales bacterium]MDU3240587.1 hypothetical protein [Clostridiales bacterium]
MIGIEMTGNSIHIVSGFLTGKGVRISDAFSIPTPWGALRNGYIKNAKGLSSELKGALLDHNLIKEKQVCFVVDGTALKRKEVEVPVEKREIILQIMQREMGELIADEDHIIDYIVKEVFKKNHKKYMRCILYAIPKIFLRDYMGLCEESNLNLKNIDTLNESIIKQLDKKDKDIIKEQITVSMKTKKLKKTNKKKANSIENFEGESGIESNEYKRVSIQGKVKLWIGLYYEKIKIMTNGIDGDIFTKTIMLEGLNTNLGEDTEYESEIEAEKNMMILYIKEIKQFIAFQKSVLPDQPVENIYLYGEFSLLAKMCELTEAMVDLPTTFISIPKAVKGISSTDYPKYAGAIGCLLRS